MAHKQLSRKKTSLISKGLVARISQILFAFMFSQTLFAQGGTHPGFDPDFGLFAPLENRILLGLFVIGAISAIYIIKRKKNKK